ncbi:hypothetical protein HMPREF9690_03080 [Raoultella ornithinolytica 10-5246]|nr:hypothetical protein HMPREF9690_03080 [Raoultella ornithinolytica 10-5246]
MANKNNAMPTYALLRNAVGSTDGPCGAKTVSFGNKIKVNVKPNVFLA